MDDAAAYMELVRANAQGELTALERGMHALHSGMTERAYADQVGRSKSTVHEEMAAAKVADACPDIRAELSRHWQCLVAIHAAPGWLWSALVSKMVADGLTVEATRKMVAEVKDAPEPPQWSDREAIASALVGGSLSRSDLSKFEGTAP